MAAEKALDQQLHRALNKQGYSLHKSRKAVGAYNYTIVNFCIDDLVPGSDYNKSLKEVVEWLRERCEE